MSQAEISLVVDLIADKLGVDVAAVFGVIALVSLVCRMVGKLIPDDAKGPLGVIRRVCKVLGLYVSNRISSGVTVAGVAKSAARLGMK